MFYALGRRYGNGGIRIRAHYITKLSILVITRTPANSDAAAILYSPQVHSSLPKRFRQADVHNIWLHMYKHAHNARAPITTYSKYRLRDARLVIVLSGRCDRQAARIRPHRGVSPIRDVAPRHNTTTRSPEMYTKRCNNLYPCLRKKLTAPKLRRLRRC